MQKNLFFIAILPSEEIRQEVRDFKLFAKENFRSGHALSSPAHITLQPPFRFPMADFNLLDNTVREFTAQQTSFYLSLKNFSAFPPRVIFVDIAESPELGKLQQQLSFTLKTALGIENDRPYQNFHPHMTVAFKDLKKDIFESAWQYFSKLDYQRFFQVRSLFILKHENKKWHLFREYLLK